MAVSGRAHEDTGYMTAAIRAAVGPLLHCATFVASGLHDCPSERRRSEKNFGGHAALTDSAQVRRRQDVAQEGPAGRPPGAAHLHPQGLRLGQDHQPDALQGRRGPRHVVTGSAQIRPARHRRLLDGVFSTARRGRHGCDVVSTNWLIYAQVPGDALRLPRVW